ncbi:unnamed protein product [Closterium sp. Naga37s-1]|nr:unnamed protein product [Closterium sp. Naga37s-1]
MRILVGVQIGMALFSVFERGSVRPCTALRCPPCAAPRCPALPRAAALPIARCPALPRAAPRCRAALHCPALPPVRCTALPRAAALPIARCPALPRAAPRCRSALHAAPRAGAATSWPAATAAAARCRYCMLHAAPRAAIAARWLTAAPRYLCRSLARRRAARTRFRPAAAH